MPVLAICFSALSGSFISAFVPAVNAELLLMGLAVATPPAWLLPVIALTTVGQMSGKTLLYLVGRGLVLVPVGRAGSWVARATARVDRHQRVGGSILFTSALAGLPPFYLTSISAGVSRFSFRGFLVLGTLGRFLRFAAVALVPVAVRSFL